MKILVVYIAFELALKLECFMSGFALNVCGFDSSGDGRIRI